MKNFVIIGIFAAAKISIIYVRNTRFNYFNIYLDAIKPSSPRFKYMRILAILSFVLLLYSCSRVSGVFQRKQQVYQPPRLGAESRFEDGLRKEKHPQNLFSKKERKDMEKMGRLSTHERTATKTRITAMQADSILTGKTRDTARIDTTKQIP